jgi:hypothetical protein
MPAEYIAESPYTRALRWTGNANNRTLVRWCVDAVDAAWPLIEWPSGIPRRDAARIAHAYAKDVVQYVREDGDQLIRMPWRTVADGQGDCKSLAVLVASLCRAAGRRVVLRFVKFPGENWFGHVYAVVDGVAVDPELEFSEEVLYSHRLDVTI